MLQATQITQLSRANAYHVNPDLIKTSVHKQNARHVPQELFNTRQLKVNAPRVKSIHSKTYPGKLVATHAPSPSSARKAKLSATPQSMSLTPRVD
jgi:hypothetical protein